MDYVTLCKNFFNATNIPVSLTRNQTTVYSALGDLLSIRDHSHWEMFNPDLVKTPCFCGYSPDIEYGLVHINGTASDIIIGPAYTVDLTADLVRQMMRELSLPSSYREPLTEILGAIPRISHMQFAFYLVFFHQIVNGEVIDMKDLFIEDSSYTDIRRKNHTENLVQDKEEENLHNSYYYELEMYQKIKEGNVEKLNEFFSVPNLHLKEGKMAQSPLRHTKNIFITAAAKACFLGAIPGGVDIETAYQLTDYYIQECERLQSIDQINHLRYMMLTDFCQRAGSTLIPEGISPDLFRAMTFVRSHTNEPISIEDVAAFVGRSTSYLMKHFKDDLGIRLGAYITRCKLEEAKSLLTFSEMSLSEISAYLCFSSQSYFQNLFKKQYGVTPMQYRKQRPGTS